MLKSSTFRRVNEQIDEEGSETDSDPFKSEKDDNCEDNH